ncbi:MAG: site-specific DNA-methyltransferase [Candidatus Heimdallarchaeota archaeon]|nr:site-specific DNA-methyltransferase [Candidatus Heimdallarchaeota archaeon]
MVRIHPWDKKISLVETADVFDYLLAPQGQIAIFCSDRLQFEIYPAFSPYFDFRYRQTIIKTSATAFHRDRPRPNSEALLVFHRKGTPIRDRIFNHEVVGEEGLPWKRTNRKGSRSTMGGLKRLVDENKSGKRYPTSVVYAPNRPGMSKAEKQDSTHPSQKSLIFIRDTILLLSNPGQVVLDPFAGSGTTLVAAYQTGRSAVGFEMEPKFYDETNERLRHVFETSDVAILSDFAGIEIEL